MSWNVRCCLTWTMYTVVATSAATGQTGDPVISPVRTASPVGAPAWDALTGHADADVHPPVLPDRAFASAIVGESGPQPWVLRHMPDGLLYSSYLAGPRESRMGTAWLANSDDSDPWDTTLGGRVGILRWGTDDPLWPEGWQLDIEGAAFPRLNLDQSADLDVADFRFGVPLTWRSGPWQAKTAFYHLSSHVGDEFLERNPTFERINFSRNAIVLGLGYFVTPKLRLYAEADYGFDTDGGADPWWFQFGFDYAPSHPTGLRGAPFLAANAFLREEVDFGGTFTAMAGWAWRADRSGHLCRVGLQVSSGHTTQLEFHEESEQLVGLGIWYDF